MGDTSLDLTMELEVAQQAARAAGAYLLQRLGVAQPGKVKAARDIQLDVDLGAERILLEAITTEFPDDHILSEEAGGSEYTHGRRWIVDPLDGSFNFQHGYPLFGSIIALQIDQSTTLGVIYLPTSDEMYTAIRGQGAFRNEAPLRASTTSTLSDAIVHVSDFASLATPRTISSGCTSWPPSPTQSAVSAWAAQRRAISPGWPLVGRTDWSCTARTHGMWRLARCWWRRLAASSHG